MPTVEEIYGKLQKANRIMEELIDIATEDKTISDEEQEILFSINSNLANYAKLIIESISDNQVSEEEQNKIKVLEEKIIADAKEVAYSDGKISEDEKRLLLILIEEIESI